VRWTSAPAKTYSVLSAVDLQAGFTLRQGGIPSAGETTEYEDAAATNDERRFYKVLVE
jgi:hypothetical protein